MTDRKLTDEQVENWRKALVGLVGPYAKIMPVAQIQEMRDKLSSRFGEGKGDTSEPEPLPCDISDTVWVDGTRKAYVVKLGPSATTVKWAWGGRDSVPYHRIKTEKG